MDGSGGVDGGGWWMRVMVHPPRTRSISISTLMKECGYFYNKKVTLINLIILMNE